MVFTPQQLSQIHTCLVEAEERLSRFYRFAPREWFSYSYDLLTVRDLPAALTFPVAGVLAEVVKGPSPSTTRTSFPFGVESLYRILLFDRNILLSMERLPDVRFDRFMLYILTHELIHIVRFTHSVDFHLPPAAKTREEKKVHALTGQVLESLDDRSLGRIARLYSTSGEYSL
ncbi:MAG: hypothetical protein JXQ27_18985 [Acidobacteria bacterium]|nr:hypothetical protein [Acidobacteriota bacterium]